VLFETTHLLNYTKKETLPIGNSYQRSNITINGSIVSNIS